LAPTFAGTSFTMIALTTIAESVQLSRRRENLSRSHHAEVAERVESNRRRLDLS